jgi:hypothetical protein
MEYLKLRLRHASLELLLTGRWLLPICLAGVRTIGLASLQRRTAASWEGFLKMRVKRGHHLAGVVVARTHCTASRRLYEIFDPKLYMLIRFLPLLSFAFTSLIPTITMVSSSR